MDITVTIPETLHRDLANRAQYEGVPVEQYIVYMLTRHLSSSYVVEAVSPAEIAAQRMRYEALLEELGEPDYEEADQVLAERPLAPPEKRIDPDLLARVNAKVEALTTNR